MAGAAYCGCGTDRFCSDGDSSMSVRGMFESELNMCAFDCICNLVPDVADAAEEFVCGKSTTEPQPLPLWPMGPVCEAESMALIWDMVSPSQHPLRSARLLLELK
jgi:hypothetical protein